MVIGSLSRSSFVLVGAVLAACSSDSVKKANPDAPGIPPADASIVSPDGAGLDASGEIQGEAARTASLTISPASIDLGRVPQLVPSPPQAITIIATADVSDLTVTLAGDDIRLENTTTCGKTLAEGASCRVVITFVSRTSGERSDSVTILAGGQTTIVPVTATVVNDTLLVTPTTPQSFGASLGQTSSPVTFFVPNAGDTAFGPVTFEITGTNAADFRATATGCDRIAPGEVCTIYVVFTPKASSSSTENASLVVTGPGPEPATALIALVGTVYAFDSIWLVGPPDLGSAAVGTTGSPVILSLRNSGSAAAGPFTVTLSSAEFVLTEDTCSTGPVPAGDSCTIGVALRPRSEGVKTATLTVGTPTGSPAVKMLLGKGVAVDGGAEPLDGGDLDAAEAEVGSPG